MTILLSFCECTVTTIPSWQGLPTYFGTYCKYYQYGKDKSTPGPKNRNFLKFLSKICVKKFSFTPVVETSFHYGAGIFYQVLWQFLKNAAKRGVEIARDNLRI